MPPERYDLDDYRHRLASKDVQRGGEENTWFIHTLHPRILELRIGVRVNHGALNPHFTARRSHPTHG